jgi:hypothetical protein
MSNFDYKKYLVENKLTSNSRMLNEEDGTYTQKEILRGSMQGFKAPKPENLKVDMMVAPNMAYLDNQELLNQQMGRITAINGNKVTYKKGDGKLYTTEVDDLIIVGGLTSEVLKEDENDPGSFDINQDWSKIKILGLETDHQGEWVIFADPEDPYLDEEGYSFAIQKREIDQVVNGEKIGVEDGSSISHYMTSQDAKKILSQI